ncbi:MAG: aldo/keto reductase [Clostridia bacterium]|nr:aldo/keto reductase [Clostridia bacterium]MBP3651826.1 aldo/keto reductase [Clostridia bacterium]
MQTVQLGASGLSVSKLCFGTLTMSPLQRNMSPEDGAKLLVYAYERGVRFLDTADLYETYPHIRAALKDAPDYVISTKAYCYDRETAQAALERAFRGLGRDYVDLFMLHEQESLYTLRGHEEALLFLEEQRRKGHIGAVGVSTHYAGCVQAAPRFPAIKVVHPIINVGGIGIQDGSREDMEKAIAHAREFGIGIFAMKPLGGGHLIQSNREALEYALNNPLLDSVAVGMQTYEEIDANIAIANGDAEAIERLDHLHKRKREMMVHDYCEGCGRCAERCGQKAISIVNGRAQIDESKCVFCGYCARVCPQFCIKVV